MRSWVAFVPAICWTALLCLAAMPTSGRQRGAAAPSSEQKTWSFFSKNCTSCHNPKTQAGALDLNVLRKAGSITRNRDIWTSVQRKIRTGEMPPEGSAKPPQSEVKSVVQRIESELERVDRVAPTNPGRVTAHRLNRAEYNNTIRDLLGINLRLADDFPQDDSGYGFDNNGDVLSLSSSQMEKYVTAAEKAARTAIFGPELLQPTLIRHEVSGRKFIPSTKVPASYDRTGLIMRNSLHATHRFPVDGEYIFRFGMGGFRPSGSDPLQLGLWIDGKRATAMDLDAEGSSGFEFDRQDFAGRTQECKLRVPSGDHWVAATIENMYDGLPASYNGPKPSKRVVKIPEFKPPPGLSPERISEIRKRIESRKRTVLSISEAKITSLEIGGPYLQAKGPSDEVLKRVFVCGHLHAGHQPDCARKIVANFVNRAFRRPATTQEIARLTNLVALAQKQGDSFEEGICLAVQGILVSPHFLFRIERDPVGTTSASAHLITQHELASRLSYFLWSTMPDDELRRYADTQTLRKPGVLAMQVRRMLKDPRSRSIAENFGGQWLQFRALESVKPDRERFPDFDEYLRMSMRQETETFFDSIVKDDRSVLDLLIGKYTYLNQRLAGFYGISGVEGPAFRKVDLTGSDRGGILTQASVLTVTSYPNRTSPVLRGKWILDNILNAPPPAPPPGVPNLDVAAVGKDTSLRLQLEQHRKNPTCAACHARMDPLGFGLENFDAVGAWRKNDGKILIDSSGSLPDGRTFQGADGLRNILKADRDAFAKCLTTKLLTYALGRGLESYDRGTLNEIAKRNAANDYRFSNLVLEIVSSKPFQMRQGDKPK